MLTLLFKLNRASFVHSMRSGQSLSASYLIRNSFAKYVVVSPQAATSESVRTGMKTYEVQNALALGPLFLVYPTHELCLLRFACVLKSLRDARP